MGKQKRGREEQNGTTDRVQKNAERRFYDRRVAEYNSTYLSILYNLVQLQPILQLLRLHCTVGTTVTPLIHEQLWNNITRRHNTPPTVYYRTLVEQG